MTNNTHDSFENDSAYESENDQSISLEKEYGEDISDEMDFEVPLDVHIGFYSNIKEKQVKKHVLSYAEKNFSSLNDVTYQILAHEDGFLFEIQQSGSGLGYISDYMENDYDDALIITSSNIYRVAPSTHGGFRLVKLTDDDVKDVSNNPDNFDILEGRDKLKPLKSTGFGFFVFASIFFALSVLSVGVSASLKYLVLDKTAAVYFTNAFKTYPHTFIPDIQNETYQMDLSSEYFSNFYFDSSAKGDKKWSVEKESILGNSNDEYLDSELEGMQ